MKSVTTEKAQLTPGASLLAQVRSGFIYQGTSLSKWCIENGVCRVWATDALRGKRNGPRAAELRALLWTRALPNHHLTNEKVGVLA
jgi:endonuclease YncB( thermonuclease family)